MYFFLSVPTAISFTFLFPASPLPSTKTSLHFLTKQVVYIK